MALRDHPAYKYPALSVSAPSPRHAHRASKNPSHHQHPAILFATTVNPQITDSANESMYARFHPYHHSPRENSGFLH